MSDQTPKTNRGGNPNWRKGKSGNPKGRPRTGLALAERIRERLDPDMILDLAARVAADETIPVDKRLDALLRLAVLGYVRPPTGVAIDARFTGDGGARLDWTRLPLDQRRTLLAGYRAALVQGDESAPYTPGVPGPLPGNSEDNEA
jgi:hypothetical protein